MGEISYLTEGGSKIKTYSVWLLGGLHHRLRPIVRSISKLMSYFYRLRLTVRSDELAQ